MFKPLSCWNQQSLPSLFFLKEVRDSEKCPYSQAQTEGLNLKEGFLCVRAGDSHRECRQWMQDTTVCALACKDLATAAYCGIKTFHNEFVQIARSLLLLSLINSLRWLDGALHTVFWGQSSSPHQLALPVPPKTDWSAAQCIDLCAHTHSDTNISIPP